MRLLPTAAAIALLLPAQLIAQRGNPLIFILAGQSNMAGQGITAELTSEQATVPANVKYFSGSAPTLFSGQSRFGPEVALAHELARAYPNREIWLVKHAIGGTSLLAWAPRWDSLNALRTGDANAGPLYHELLELIGRLHVPAGSEFGAVFWMQGERDAKFPEVARQYFTNLRELIAAFRRDLHSPAVPFVLGLVNPPADAYPAVRVVREAQRQAARKIPATYLVETAGLTKHEDHLHYDTAGIMELGRRFSAVIIRLRTASGRM